MLCVTDIEGTKYPCTCYIQGRRNVITKEFEILQKWKKKLLPFDEFFDARANVLRYNVYLLTYIIDGPLFTIVLIFMDLLINFI